MDRRNFLKISITASVSALAYASLPNSVKASLPKPTIIEHGELFSFTEKELKTSNQIKKEIIEELNSYIGDINDSITRQNITNNAEKICKKHDIYNYSVICNEINNSPERIDMGKLYVDALIKPSNSSNLAKFQFNI